MVNYPNGKKSTWTSSVSAGGRGMELEHEINLTNQNYLDEDRAVIHKKPTPVTIVKVDYPSRNKAKITEAYFKTPSTTDYNGIYRGRYIDFEAKECRVPTSFPLKSIHAHQIRHLESIIRHGGIAFAIIRFIDFNETWFVPADRMIQYINTAERSSIPHDWFTENCFLIRETYTKPVDYLEIVDRYYFEKGDTADGK